MIITWHITNKWIVYRIEKTKLAKSKKKNRFNNSKTKKSNSKSKINAKKLQKQQNSAKEPLMHLFLIIQSSVFNLLTNLNLK